MDIDKVADESLKELGKAAAKELWEKKGRLRELWKRVATWLGFQTAPDTKESQPPRAGILILGPGGTGKTTLARMLAGEVETIFDPPGPYSASVLVEHFSLLGSPQVEIVVPPGQQHRRDATWDTLLSDISAARFRGVVLVTAYGHQSIARDSIKEHPLFEKRKADFLPALLEQQRADELAILGRLISSLKAAPGKLWMLSVVAKQDLWWPEHDEVERYLHDGLYHEKIAELSGRNDFRHEVCSVSLVIQSWVTKENERLKPNAAGYDNVKQRESIHCLLAMIDSLREWEGRP